MRASLKFLCISAVCLALAACASTPSESSHAAVGVAHPEIWPRGRNSVPRDAAIEAEVARLLASMNDEEKVGQIIQADIGSVTPDDVRRYRLGSILNGGGSGPNGNDRALAPEWLAAADAFYDASMEAPEGRPAIPLLWGSDAVHGNANIIGATIFPHNIGLGAANNSELMRRIGEITALELRVIGQDWTFAPTIAVARDDRWGRTYESYSETPEIVTAYARAIIEGIQGEPGDSDFLRGPHVIATAKHFLGDGGTHEGRDQGDNLYDERTLRDLFAPSYVSAVGAGVQSVMASYNSWHGAKMHGNRAFLNDILIERIGLNGFVVGDWNGHGQVEGCTSQDCAASFNAGLDMFMAPDGWRALYDNTLAQVRSGEISMARLDEAVARILRVKLRAGLMEAGRPSGRQFAGNYELLGAAEHRAVARQAVRESLVLLKNEDALLPLSPRARVLVAGAGADDMGMQTGGWTISWQGNGNSRTDFPHADTIYEAIRARVQEAGGVAELRVDGRYEQRPDVAIVVFGEEPYAEFAGDRDNLDYARESDLQLLQRLQAASVPTVSVFLSGRPLYVTPEINASSAFVAAWLPGSEGGGVADMLFRGSDGSMPHDFRGRLSFSWPRAPNQTPLNVGDPNYDPLFAFGYGLTYEAPRNLGALAEASAEALAATRNTRNYIRSGRIAAPWALATDGVTSSEVENGLRVVFPARTGARIAVTGAPVEIAREANGDMSLALNVNVEGAPSSPVALRMNGAAVNLTPMLRGLQGEGEITVRLSCFAARGADVNAITTPFELSTDGRLGIVLRDVRIEPGEGQPSCPPPAAN